MKRKFFASVISVVLTFCVVFPCGAANAASNGKGGENLVMEYTLLAKSGIIDYYDTDSAWDDVRMKRIDIINAAANMTGYNPQFPYETSLPYTDIVPGYEQLNVIRFAYATELINGSQNLAPEKTLDFQFAIEVLTNACGYGPVARAKNNYRSTKAYSKLAAGVKSSDYVSMNDFVRLLYNVFDVDYMERVSYGICANQSAEFSVLTVNALDGSSDKTDKRRILIMIYRRVYDDGVRSAPRACNGRNGSGIYSAAHGVQIQEVPRGGYARSGFIAVTAAAV